MSSENTKTPKPARKSFKENQQSVSEEKLCDSLAESASTPSSDHYVTPPKKEWAVYIIESDSGKLYTGITTDVERRYDEHATNPKKGARFFRTSRPKKLVYSEKGFTRSEAGKREIAIKRMTRADKLKLCKK
ncbi:MAG: GIY-YIG nuclease family protein [Candidatus Nitronauta litoralis]|uniref:GIY-YIG nuclease family protein n=1 Tax=Candidatus Nitronauta litoralis TaxID=2705533 RepID=A0A7T0FZU8_9BACT|nr:MAG: GIY-YIG nuclease family protein [Candidatus Nitronauta litoralis]